MPISKSPGITTWINNFFGLTSICHRRLIVLKFIFHRSRHEYSSAPLSEWKEILHQNSSRPARRIESNKKRGRRFPFIFIYASRIAFPEMYIYNKKKEETGREEERARVLYAIKVLSPTRAHSALKKTFLLLLLPPLYMYGSSCNPPPRHFRLGSSFE